MSIVKLKLMAGVPITKQDTLTEADSSKSDVGRAITRFIKSIDFKMGTSDNREYKTKWSGVASDFEDILMMVRAGKELKAVKMFNEVSKENQQKFYDSLAQANHTKRAKTDLIKAYFSPAVTEGCSSEDEEAISQFVKDNEQEPEQSEQPIESELDLSDDEPMPAPSETDEPVDSTVECPYCEYTCPKENFYDHIVKDHIGGNDEDEMPEENPEDEMPDIADTGEIPYSAHDGQKSLVSNMGTIALTFEDQQLKEAAVDAIVWDKTDDKDESPSPYPEEDKDESTVKCPKNVKDALTKEIDELQKQAELIIKSDYNTSEFYTNVANAMTEVLNYLEMESEYGIKMAQICITKYMSPIVQKFPYEVYDYILRGGQPESITALFKKSKDTNNATI